MSKAGRRTRRKRLRPAANVKPAKKGRPAGNHSIGPGKAPGKKSFVVPDDEDDDSQDEDEGEGEGEDEDDEEGEEEGDHLVGDDDDVLPIGEEFTEAAVNEFAAEVAAAANANVRRGRRRAPPANSTPPVRPFIRAGAHPAQVHHESGRTVCTSHGSNLRCSN